VFNDMKFQYPLPNIKRIKESYYDTYIIWLENFVNNECSRFSGVFRLFPKEGWERLEQLGLCSKEREWLKVVSREVRRKWREHYVETTRKNAKKKDSTGLAEPDGQSNECSAICTEPNVPEQESN